MSCHFEKKVLLSFTTIEMNLVLTVMVECRVNMASNFEPKQAVWYYVHTQKYFDHGFRKITCARFETYIHERNFGGYISHTVFIEKFFSHHFFTHVFRGVLS
jgi:hypothetical protein